MKQRQQGFTMIELIIVIVILGILAAVALPRFIDVSSDAKSAALKGVAGAAASAMTINYAGCAVTGQVVTANKCVKVDDCDDVGSLLQGGLPAGYTVTSLPIDGTDATVANGDEDTCTITQGSGVGAPTATFIGVAAGN